MATAILEIPALPARSIVFNPPLSDEEFERLCTKTEFAFLERTKEGTILMNAPAGGSTSRGNAEITRQLTNWWIQHELGGVFDSSGGFFLPDGSMLNPDAAYATADQMKALTGDDMDHFPRFAPAFVIELRSRTDRLSVVERKVEAWIANGVRLAWLIDPYDKSVHVYEHGEGPRVESGGRVVGSGPIEGFVLDLERVWRCYL
jgi:Uma2 family endonuclease